MSQSDAIKPWLDFVSTLIWQLTVIGILIYFRKSLGELIKKLTKVKFGETEATFEQASSQEAISPGGKAEVELEVVDPAGLLTNDEVKRLIGDSGLIQPNEQVKYTFLLFQSKRQGTWLVSTNKQLFCILDDEGTRTSGRLIQWKMGLDQASPVKTNHQYKPTVGLIDIDGRTDWLYSKRLHPDPEKLKADIESMISKSKS